MKHLSDDDIQQMANTTFAPNVRVVRNSVRQQLHMSTRIPSAPDTIPSHVVLDLHQNTIEMAWEKIINLAKSGTRNATIITGASGVLRQLFPQWANDSVLSPYIHSFKPINNGSFSVVFRRVKQD